MLEKRFKKGYPNDAGFDVVCDKTFVFPPLTMTTIELEQTCTPLPDTCAVLVARTSAAKQGLIISMRPIDADYTGKLTAIVFNGSRDTIVYEKGQAFAQIIFVALAVPTIQPTDVDIKHQYERRGNNKIGSTGR